MKIITKRQTIAAARASWLAQYERYPDRQLPGWNKNITFGAIRQNLSALDIATCSAADINDAIGLGAQGNWASIECDECERDVPVLVRIGEEPAYEARWQDLCVDCLRRALTLAEAGAAP